MSFTVSLGRVARLCLVEFRLFFFLTQCDDHDHDHKPVYTHTFIFYSFLDVQYIDFAVDLFVGGLHKPENAAKGYIVKPSNVHLESVCASTF